jgi:hypothetical protein
MPTPPHNSRSSDNAARTAAPISAAAAFSFTATNFTFNPQI